MNAAELGDVLGISTATVLDRWKRGDLRQRVNMKAANQITSIQTANDQSQIVKPRRRWPPLPGPLRMSPTPTTVRVSGRTASRAAGWDEL